MSEDNSWSYRHEQAAGYDASRRTSTATVKDALWQLVRLGVDIGKATVYHDPHDWWIGYYRGPDDNYVCPLPTIVVRWPRKGVAEERPLRGAARKASTTTRLQAMATAKCENYWEGTCADEPRRSPNAPYLADGYCWPCRVRALLGTQ
jgi:hypothetical protein